MSRYIRVADRHKPRLKAGNRRVRCKRCRKLTGAPYWWNIHGKPLLKPLCPRCHERHVARITREDVNE